MWKWLVGLGVWFSLESSAILVPSGYEIRLAANCLGAALMVVAAAWFMRRRAARQAAASPSVATASSWASLADSKLIIGAVLVGLAGSAGPIVVRSSDAYTLTMASARSSARFTDALGSPVSEGWFPSAEFRYGEPPTAELEVSVSGPKADGSLRAAATRTGEKWQLQRLALRLATASDEIDLLK